MFAVSHWIWCLSFVWKLYDCNFVLFCSIFQWHRSWCSMLPRREGRWREALIHHDIGMSRSIPKMWHRNGDGTARPENLRGVWKLWQCIPVSSAEELGVGLVTMISSICNFNERRQFYEQLSLLNRKYEISFN